MNQQLKAITSYFPLAALTAYEGAVAVEVVETKSVLATAARAGAVLIF